MSETALVPLDVQPGIDLQGLAEQVLARALASDDPEWLWNGATNAAAYAQKWKSYGLDTTHWRRMQMYCAVPLAQMLGPRPGWGDFYGNQHVGVSHAIHQVGKLIPQPRMSELQQLYGHADVLLREIQAGEITSWRQLIQRGRTLSQRDDGAEPCRSGPPESRQHFDVWSFLESAGAGGAPGFFGRMPPQVVENVLWLWTEPGDVVVDPFAGGGTTLDIGRRMGRNVWASDLTPRAEPGLAIHRHDITTGWPDGAPCEADLILLDPPYWRQAAGRYSDDPRDLGNQPLSAFMASWRAVLAACVPHVRPGGYLAFIISPTQTDDRVVDHAFEMYAACLDAGLEAERRVIVTYQTQQATGQQVRWAREHRRLLKLYRDLVVLRRP